MKLLINLAGVWAFSYEDQSSSGATLIGISKNASSLTTAISNLSNTFERLGYVQTAAANSHGGLSTTIRVEAGDIIRAHTDGGPNSSANTVRFSATYVGP